MHDSQRLKRISLGAFITDFVQRGSGRDELFGYRAAADGLWILKTSVH